MSTSIVRSIRNGALAFIIMLTIYVLTVSLVSGWVFMLIQLSKYWYFIAILALGFGIQVGLFTYLKNEIKQKVTARVLVASGTTSTVAMVSCCAHYLVNLLPILGMVGIITVISEYQVQLFWVGLVINFAGILYTLSRIIKFSKKL